MVAFIALFIFSWLLAVAGGVTRLVVLFSLHKRGVKFYFGLSGMPGYVNGLVSELPADTENQKIIRLNRQSNILFAVGLLGFLICAIFAFTMA